MELVHTFEEKEVRRLLTVGPDGDLEEAFTQIDAQFRKRFVKGARNRITGLAAHDLADAWQEALRDLFRSVQLGQFDPECGIAPGSGESSSEEPSISFAAGSATHKCWMGYGRGWLGPPSETTWNASNRRSDVI